MATCDIVSENAWATVEGRALKLFCTYRNLEFDDSILAVLVAERTPELAQRALRLIEQDGGTSFSQAFQVVRTTDRQFDTADLLPFEEVRHAA